MQWKRFNEFANHGWRYRTDEWNFYMSVIRYLLENDDLQRQREWNETIPRMFY